jgi:hypothetical protein
VTAQGWSGPWMGEPGQVCEVCAFEREDCWACEGSGEDPDRSDGECLECAGAGEVIPTHCCACGGSPYCVACHVCGAACVGDCDCPVTVRLIDGTTRTL